MLLPMECRLYVDEVGNADLKGSALDDNTRYLSLTGLITKIHLHESRIAPELMTFKTDVFGPTIGRTIILHRREVVRREGVFAALRNPDTQTKFDAGLLHLVDKLPFLVCTVVIDKRMHFDTYKVWHFDPYHYCMRCLLERYVLWMRRHRFKGDVVVEPRYKKVDKKLKASFLRTYEEGTENIGPHVFQTHLTSREIKFSPKPENVAGLQLADLIAYPSYKAARQRYEGVTATADYGAKIVEILQRKKYARNPKNHEHIDGWGLKWLP